MGFLEFVVGAGRFKEDDLNAWRADREICGGCWMDTGLIVQNWQPPWVTEDHMTHSDMPSEAFEACDIRGVFQEPSNKSHHSWIWIPTNQLRPVIQLAGKVLKPKGETYSDLFHWIFLLVHYLLILLKHTKIFMQEKGQSLVIANNLPKVLKSRLHVHCRCLTLALQVCFKQAILQLRWTLKLNSN